MPTPFPTTGQKPYGAVLKSYIDTSVPLVLDAADPVPPGTPAGTIIMRRT
jgi:hypothetical protein